MEKLKQPLIILFSLLCLTVNAQDIYYNVGANYGANYSIVEETPQQGVRGTVFAEAEIMAPEENFSFVAGLEAGYFSLSNTVKTGMAAGYVGFSDGKFITGGLKTTYFSESKNIGGGMWGRLTLPVNDKLRISVSGEVNHNILNQNEGFTAATAGVGVIYRL